MDVDPDVFHPLVQNGALVDQLFAGMNAVHQLFCLVLLHLWEKATEEYITEYCLANFLPELVDVVVLPSAHKALLYYATEEDYQDAAQYNWSFGVVCPVARLDPLGDHGAFFRVSYFCFSSFITNLETQLAAAFKHIGVKIISAAWSPKHKGQLCIYLNGMEDYITVINHGKPIQCPWSQGKKYLHPAAQA